MMSVKPLAACLFLLLLTLSASEAQAQARAAAKPEPVAGIEPDEIDARQSQRSRPATVPATRETRATPARATNSPMPTPGNFVAQKGGDGATKYETADCSTPTKSITCCTAGDSGASCNLFILLCEENGGAGKGDGGDAICVN